MFSNAPPKLAWGFPSFSCPVLVGILLASVVTGHAAPPSHVWSRAFGSTNHGAYGNSIAVADDGSIALVGYFLGSIDFGAGAVSSMFSNDMFLAKFDRNGSCLWSRAIGDPNIGDDSTCVAVDPIGRVILAGHSVGTVNFGGGPMTGAGDYDICVAVFDVNGAHVWSRRFGDASAQYIYSVDATLDGSVLLTGMFWGSVDFGGGPLTSNGSTDVFLAKFGPSGEHLWSRSYGDVLSQNGISVADDEEGAILLSGYGSGTVDFGGGPLVSNGTSAFLAKLDANGSHVWSKAFGSGLFGRLAVDGAGSVFLSGSYGGTVDFGGQVLSSTDGLDVFIAKFDSDGNHVWSHGWGGQGDQYAVCLAADAGGAVVAGLFAGDVDFGNGLLVSAGDYDAFVAAFDSEGQGLWSASYGDANFQAARSIGLDGGDLLITGEFSESVSFGSGSLVSAGYTDAFLARLRTAPATGVRNDLGRLPVFSAQPNPFTSTSRISYTLTTREYVTLSIYNAAGRLVLTLVDGDRGPGTYELTWDGIAMDGERLSSGVYFCRLATKGFSESRKLVLIK